MDDVTIVTHYFIDMLSGSAKKLLVAYGHEVPDELATVPDDRWVRLYRDGRVVVMITGRSEDSLLSW